MGTVRAGGAFVAFAIAALLTAGEARPATVVYSSELCGTAATRTASDEAACHTPAFTIDEGEKSYNKIGEPEARAAWCGERVSVDPERPVVYVGARSDVLGSRPVTHLLYRIHFTKLPFQPRVFFEMHRNPGLMALVTIDEETREPWLLTTVQTCGCYHAIVPTDRFPAEALPADWLPGPQKVWGKELPAVVSAPVPGSSRLLLRMEPRTHRVIGVETVADLPAGERRDLELAPMAGLRALPVKGAEGRTTSFFHESGLRKGYVKNAWSPIEGLTLGLVIFDPMIGSDKDFGDPAETGTRFYTMLLPWNREVSRLDRFDPLMRKLGFRMDNLMRRS